MRMKPKWKRAFSAATALVMAASLMVPGTGSAAAIHTSMLDGKNLAPSKKVSSRLLEQFKSEGDKITFLVKFQDKADTKAAAERALNQVQKGGATAHKAKLAKRSAVVSELKATSLSSQHAVKALLEKEEAKGNVKEYESFFIVNGMAVTATKEIAQKIASMEGVEKVLPNETRQLFTSVQAPPKKEAKKETKEPAKQVQNIEWNIEKVGAPRVWQMGIDGTGTVVASIDTGAQWNHPALKEKYRGYHPANPNTAEHALNWYDATSAGRAEPYDDIGHGTHVTGTMVGSEPNGANQIGVAPGAKWIAVKAFTSSGGTDRDLLRAGEWLIAPRDAQGNLHPEAAPDVINNSWGGGPGLDEWFREMVQNWRAADIFPEFSAGNTNFSNPGGPGSVAAPSNYPESFATGATDINNKIANFSLRGPSPYNEIKPDISAPGVNIRSSVPGSGYEGGWNGTSMAGPHVSAVVALLKQVNASLTVDEIEQILINTATPLTDSSYPDTPNHAYGYGLVSAYDAVSSIINGLGKVKGQVAKQGNDTEPPAITHTAPSETFTNMDLELNADVSDNVSISSVKVEYKNQAGSWVTVEAKRAAGDYKSGSYKAVIPAADIAQPSLEYRWKAVDFGSNETQTGSFTVEVKPGITVGYVQDFENGAPGWTSFGDLNPWELGVPTSGPKSASSGVNVYATKLAGNYEPRTNATLVMPPVDLPEGASYLQFKQWHDLERNYDFGHVFVSTDKKNWTQLLRVNGLTSAWQSAEVDLSQYAGQRIYLGFNLTTDGSVQKAGWYIDDVKLSDQSISSKSSIGLTKGNLGIGNGGASDSLKKEKVNPADIKPAMPEAKEPPAKDQPVNPALLPVQAKVSVLESGRSVTTNPANGQYELMHPAGTFTVKAEAYGYQSQQQTVTIENNGEAAANFVLTETPQGTITGTVTNKSNGEPVAGATVLLVEDAAVTPVQTDSAGHFTLTAYEGTYTLKVIAPSYHSADQEVTVSGNTNTEASIILNPILSYPGGEIGYDDGTAENARAFYDAGNGWAVKMSLPEGKTSGIVKAGVFRFWTTDWPSPGGTEFQVEVWDASGANGAPGKKLAGPFNATALRNGEWTVVDLSAESIVVGKDFYMTYIQTKANPNAPGLATDEDSTNAKRSWQYVGGAWSQSPADEGNYMIRARIDYNLEVPSITSPKDGSFTNKEKITVEGSASPGTSVIIKNNGTDAATVIAAENGTFAAELSLADGPNTITARGATDRGDTDESQPVTVTLDKTAPQLTIENPKNGDKLNKETITVEGAVSDEHLADVTVNGQKAAVRDGKYSKRIMLDPGENVIEVAARDEAGNETRKSVTIQVQYEGPVIDNVLPTADKELKTGQSVKIEFDSTPGLKATFAILMPLTDLTGVENATELPMMETADGHYVGYYTATNIKASGAEIEVKAKDSFGNETRKRAPGKLYINTKKQTGSLELN